MGPNFFIWVAIGIVVAATAGGLMEQHWAPWIGYPLAIALAAFNKVRAIRRRKDATSRTFA